MQLATLLTYIDKAYGDGACAQFFDPETGHFRNADEAPFGDSLARFVVLEIIDNFDPDDDDEAQLTEAANAIDRALADLQRVYDALDPDSYRPAFNLPSP